MSFPLQHFPKILISVIVILISFFPFGCSRANRIDHPALMTVSQSPNAININSATADELEKLPDIGETLARRIVEFRERNGPFRRAENLLMVDGISEKKFREIRILVKTD